MKTKTRIFSVKNVVFTAISLALILFLIFETRESLNDSEATEIERELLRLDSLHFKQIDSLDRVIHRIKEKKRLDSLRMAKSKERVRVITKYKKFIVYETIKDLDSNSFISNDSAFNIFSNYFEAIEDGERIPKADAFRRRHGSSNDNTRTKGNNRLNHDSRIIRNDVSKDRLRTH